MTPSVLIVSEKGMGVPAIVGDSIGGRVRRRWRVPIRIDSALAHILIIENVLYSLITEMKYHFKFFLTLLLPFSLAFNAFTMLVRHQEEYLACKS